MHAGNQRNRMVGSGATPMTVNQPFAGYLVQSVRQSLATQLLVSQLRVPQRPLHPGMMFPVQEKLAWMA